MNLKRDYRTVNSTEKTCLCILYIVEVILGITLLINNSYSTNEEQILIINGSTISLVLIMIFNLSINAYVFKLIKSDSDIKLLIYLMIISLASTILELLLLIDQLILLLYYSYPRNSLFILTIQVLSIIPITLLSLKLLRDFNAKLKIIESTKEKLSIEMRNFN